jgi:Uma2 family endonuclease
MGRVLAKVSDYLNFGVPYVWVIDPRKRSGTVYTAKDSTSPEDGILRTQNPAIALPLADLF